jgi:hypothetical protein
LLLLLLLYYYYLKMDLQEVERGGMDWIELAQHRDRRWALVNAILNLRGSIKYGEFLDRVRTRQLLRNRSAPRS